MLFSPPDVLTGDKHGVWFMDKNPPQQAQVEQHEKCRTF